MVATAFGALSSAQKRVWSTKVNVAGRDANFWLSNGFIGSNTSDMNSVVQRITELTETERGRTVVMQLVAELQNDGVVGDNELEGNEEALINDSQEVRIDQIRNGIRSRGKMAEQETVLRFRSLSKDKLGFWLADTIDELMFLTGNGRAFTLQPDGATRTNSQLSQLNFAADISAATTNRIKYAGSASSEATLTASDKMSWNFLVSTAAFAKRKRIKQIRNKGKQHYAVIMSTEQARDLKQDSNYQTIVRSAGPRGASNALFNNAFAVVDGLILYEHPKIYTTFGLTSSNKWGSSGTVDGAQAQLLGAQSLGFAQIGQAHWEESDNTDYKNRPGVAYGRILGMLKPQYKSSYDSNTREDFGTIAIKTAAAA